MFVLNPIGLRKAKIVYNFGLSECNMVKIKRNPMQSWGVAGGGGSRGGGGEAI